MVRTALVVDVTSCLNPCSNGMKIECEIEDESEKERSLNPCSNGVKIE